MPPAAFQQVSIPMKVEGVTCIIPVKDRRRMVLRAIESAMNQTRTVDEVIVVDDGSRDGTAREVASTFPQVRLLRISGLGPGGARNAGAKAAWGGVLMFLDSDDRWLPGHVEALLEGIEQGFNVCYGVTRTWDRTGGTGFLVPEPGQGVHGHCLDALLQWCFLVPSSVAVTKQAFERAGGFGPGRLGEDWMFFLALGRDHPFFFKDEIITHRLLHRGSLCRLEDSVGQITGLLCRVRSFAGSYPSIGHRHAERILRAMELAKEKGAEWKTVQDWFTAMKREGLV